MNRKLEYRVILPLFVFIVLAYLFLTALSLMGRTGGFEAKLPLPQDALPSLLEEGITHRLADWAEEGPYVLNIFASWCMPCRVEHPLLEALSRQVPLYGYDWRDDRDDVMEYLSRYGNPYRGIAYDQPGTVGIALGITGTPETLLIDRHGMIVWRFVGALDDYIITHELMPRYERLRHED